MLQLKTISFHTHVCNKSRVSLISHFFTGRRIEELEFKLTPNAIVISHFLSLEKHDCDEIRRYQKTVFIKIGRVRRSFLLLNQNILSIPLGLRTLYLYQVMIIATDYKLYLLLFLWYLIQHVISWEETVEIRLKPPLYSKRGILAERNLIKPSQKCENVLT